MKHSLSILKAIITLSFFCGWIFIQGCNKSESVEPTPTIVSFSPVNGAQGTDVIISGSNFSADPLKITVDFNGIRGGVASSTLTSIRATVPAGSTTGKITVTANGKKITSADDFTSLQSATDADGNLYGVLALGNQIWLTEDLMTTKYSNGDLIGTTSPSSKNIGSEINPKYQWTNLFQSKSRLYTLYAVQDSRNVCPTGWHVPSQDEWLELIEWNLGQNLAGRVLKEAGTTHWTSPNDANNSSLFTALPTGGRLYDGTFESIGTKGVWWGSTEHSGNGDCFVTGNNGTYFRASSGYQKDGHAVRCIKNQ